MSKERFEELKTQKAWFNPLLRDEYNKLKAEFGDKPKAVPVAPAPSGESEVAALRKEMEELRGLLNIQKTAQKTEGAGWRAEKPTSEITRTAKLRIYRPDSDSEEGVIIDSVFHKRERNEDTLEVEDMYKLTVLMPDGTTKNTILSLAEWTSISEFEIVQIVKQDREKLTRFQAGQQAYVSPSPVVNGYIQSPVVGNADARFDNKHYIESGERVPLEETMDKITCTVRLSDGREFVIDSSKLNQ